MPREISGMNAGSGLPSARLRTPAGIATGARVETGGRDSTDVPRRPAPAIKPRTRRSRNAAAIVAGLRPRFFARVRTVGNRVPGATSPEAIARSTLAETSLAVRPRIEYCSITELSLYCNKNEYLEQADPTRFQPICPDRPH